MSRIIFPVSFKLVAKAKHQQKLLWVSDKLFSITDCMQR